MVAFVNLILKKMMMMMMMAGSQQMRRELHALAIYNESSRT